MNTNKNTAVAEDRRITTKGENTKRGFEIGGWLQGKQTYLSFRDKDGHLGCISGNKLYRLAKAITVRFEEG